MGKHRTNNKQIATKYGYSEKWFLKILKENIDKLNHIASMITQQK